MPLPFAIPAALSGALRHWRLAGLALLILALGVQTLRLGNAQDKAERFKAERNAARAELVAISTAKDEQKAETGRNIEKARGRSKGAEPIARRIEAAPLPGQCRTPAEIMELDI
jgi:type II secretory pathway pseudopilin PulG